MRFLFRSFWRLLYRNPEYMKYSGGWDHRVINGDHVAAKWYDIGHWINAFKDEWFMYRHPEFGDEG